MTLTNVVKFEDGERVNDKWSVVRMLGAGSFGVVYKVTDAAGGAYALKTEKYTPRNVLKVEVKVLQQAAEQQRRYFLKLLEAGTCRGNKNNEYLIYIVMELCGASVDALRRQRSDRRFTLECALTVGFHFIDAIEELHTLGYQHRDIKAANLAVGVDDRTQFYIIDFGLCRSFCEENGMFRRPRKSAPFRGTVRYAPLACHILRETCRKDDLESWLYSQIEFTRGSLPWRDLTSIIDVGLFKERSRHDLGLAELMGGCPREYIDILRYLDTVRYYETPDYEKCRHFLRAATRHLSDFKPTYDWIDENLQAGNGNADATVAEGKPKQ